MIRVIDLVLGTSEHDFAKRLQDSLEDQRKRLVCRFIDVRVVSVVNRSNTVYAIFEHGSARNIPFSERELE